MLKDPFWQSIYLGIGMIVFSILATAGLLALLLSDIQISTLKIQSLRAEATRRANLLETIARTKQSTREVDQYRGLLSQLMPSQDDLINFPGWFATYISPYGVTASFNYSQANNPPSGAQPGYAGFSLHAEGDQARVMTLLNDLESKTPKYMIALGNLNIVATGDRVSTDSSGKLFYRDSGTSQ